jgi:large subunit ribosomal protein L3
MKALLGYKRGMTRIFDERGVSVPVTVIEAGPCVVTQVKTPAKDGYTAYQLGFGEVPVKRLTKAERGHLAAAGGKNLEVLREVRLDSDADVPALGSVLDASVFTAGERVKVTGVSRGLGWQGPIKRHGFHRQRKTHGQTDRHRAPGAVGAGTTPGRTFRGHKMAGQMGGDRVTVANLLVVAADPDRNLLAIRGAVPGSRGGLVVIRGV